VIFASGLKYIGVGTTALGWTLCAVALAAGGYWLVHTRPWSNARPAAALAADETADSRDPPGSQRAS
jgi:hypothetical protein